MQLNSLVIVISAPSGSGKTTLIKNLLQLDNRFLFAVSTTTREKRRDEIDGENYYFVTVPEFQRMIANNELIEWNKVHDNLYGITKKEIDRIKDVGKIPILDVDVQGAVVLKKLIDSAAFVFIVPPTRRDLEQRLRNRKTDSDEQISIRLANSIREIKEFRLYDYIIVNDDLDEAVRNLQAIVTAELCRKDRVAYVIDEILEEIDDNSA